MMQDLRHRSGLWTAVHLIVFLLIIVWPIPGTIALRHGLLSLLLLISIGFCFANKNQKPRVSNRKPFFVLGLLTLWIAIVISFWAVEPSLSWGEFYSQWLVALAVGWIGWTISRAAEENSIQRAQSLVMTIFWALLTLVLLHNAFDAFYWVSSGQVPYRMSPVMSLPVFLSTWPLNLNNAFVINSPDKMSYVTNLLAAILVAEVAQRVIQKKRWLTCGNAMLGVAVALVLLCAYWLRVRNGSTGLIMLLTIATFMLSWRLKQRFGMLRVTIAALALLAGLATIAVLMVRSDSRWLKFEQTIPIAWDTDTNRAWLFRHSYPLMPNGEVVDLSAYERLAWAKEGVKLIIDNPLGTGYNRTAFGDNVERKYQQYGQFRGGHAHSDLIEFSIANGVVGLALWFAFLTTLICVGWRAFGSGQVMLGLSMMFLVSGFTGRSLVDANIKDDTLQQFFFLIMLFYGLAVDKLEKKAS